MGHMYQPTDAGSSDQHRELGIERAGDVGHRGRFCRKGGGQPVARGRLA